MPNAVCCDDKRHCCPEGSTCDIEHSKCISSSTHKETPMWAKLPARTRAEWENHTESENMVAEKSPEVTTASTVPPSEGEVPVSSVTKAAAGNDVPCDDTVACPDNTTCCKTKEGDWACCPLPEAVCCEDFIHCCPKGKKCNLAAQTCDDDSCSVPWVEKIPTIPGQDAQQVGDVACDSSYSCPDDTTCCKTKTEEWACCPLPKAVCCDDHEHCCPAGTTCDLATLSCLNSSGSTPMKQKITAFVNVESTTVAPTTQSQVPSTTQTVEEKEEEQESKDEEEDRAQEEEDEKKEEERDENGRVQCDTHSSCPQDTTCCFMTSSQRWGCCPLPKAVCCADGDHCCPDGYKCNEHQTSCVKEGLVIPWYTKLPATTNIQADHSSVQCDAQNKCPEKTSCCQLSTGEWGCCPIQNAVCCSDKKHCCPEGYSCNTYAQYCQKIVMLQLETIPLTSVFLSSKPQLRPLKQRDVKCDDQSSCPDGNTCCRTSDTTWGCCPYPDAMCCSDMLHCCPTGFTCIDGGSCTQNTKSHWRYWQMFLGNKKGALKL
ncbi:hypothetical protein PAMP_008790 [Pampus punctatissimus]